MYELTFTHYISPGTFVTQSSDLIASARLRLRSVGNLLIIS